MERRKRKGGCCLFVLFVYILGFWDFWGSAGRSLVRKVVLRMKENYLSVPDGPHWPSQLRLTRSVETHPSAFCGHPRSLPAHVIPPTRSRRGVGQFTRVWYCVLRKYCSFIVHLPQDFAIFAALFSAHRGLQGRLVMRQVTSLPSAPIWISNTIRRGILHTRRCVYI